MIFGTLALSASVALVEPIDVTGIQLEVEMTVSAQPDVVWDLLAEITNVGKWSPECVRTAWLGGQPDARPGVRFCGRNRVDSGFEWTVTCVITGADRPRRFEWVVLDDSDDAQTVDHPSSRWRFDLEPAEHGGTLVREYFIHGPGDSGLRWMIRESPERAAEIIESRCQQLRSNMLATLAAMQAAAEAQRPEPG